MGVVMKKVFNLLMFFVLLLLFNMNVFATDATNEIPEVILNVAEKGATTVKNHCMGNPGKWGFASEEEIRDLELGQGYHVKYVGADGIKTATGNSINELIDSNIIDTWQFTLDLNGKPRFFFTVGYERDAYRLIGFGGNATNFGNTRQLIDNATQEGNISFLNELVKKGGDYYFVVYKENAEFIVPVTDESSSTDVSMLSKNSPQLISVSEFVDSLKSDIKTTTENERGGSQIQNISENNESVLPMSFRIGIVVGALILIVACGYMCYHKYKRFR